MEDIRDVRRQLLDFFNAGVHAVKGDTAVAHFLRTNPLAGEHFAIAVGKAASAMLRGALDSAPEQIIRALLITKHHHVDESLRDCSTPVEIIESSHPVPGDDSLYAGKRLLEFIAATPHNAKLLVLISGGASSLVDVLPDGMTLDDLQALNGELLATGLDIGTMNRVRKSVSCVKGGKLAAYLGERSATCLLVSDVPGDRVADIGSGLLCREESGGREHLPARMEKFVQPSSADTVADEVWQRIDTHIVASLAHAKRAAGEAARRNGYEVSIDDSFTEGDATQAGVRIAAALKAAAPGVHIWGGETTMILPADPGRGGRNQHLALAAATGLAGAEGCYLLCAGTDGSDGPTQDAGGLVDGDTLARGEVSGGNAQRSLDAADSGNFLERAGDLVTTGPTGTNVMDLMIGLKRD